MNPLHHTLFAHKCFSGKETGGCWDYQWYWKTDHSQKRHYLRFYDQARKENRGDAKVISRATHTTLKHYSSTPDKPLHGDCPTGRNSWCSYNRNIATWEKTHVPIKNPLLVSVVRLMQPTFNHLGSEEFLVGCERCLDQNKNECLHHVIRIMAPVKAQRVNKQTNSQTQKSRHT